MARPRRFEPLYPRINRVVVRPCLLNRREQEARAAAPGGLHPQEELAVVPAWRASEAGQDHVVELQAFGLVDRHDLQANACAPVRQCVEFFETRLEGGIHGAGILVRLKVVEEDPRILEVGLVRNAGRAAEGKPGSFDSIAQARAQPVVHALLQDRPSAFEASAALCRQGSHAGSVAHEVAEVRLAALCERRQVRERQPAPRRAQHRQPRTAVGRVRQRPREREQVLHHGPLREAFDLDGPEGQPGCFELRHDLGEVAARAHEDRDGGVCIVRVRLAHDVGDPTCLAFAVRVEKRVYADRRALEPGMHRHRRRIRHRARRGIVPARHRVRERCVHPLDDAGLRAEIGAQADRLECHRGDPFTPRFQEEAHVRLAKAVD